MQPTYNLRENLPNKFLRYLLILLDTVLNYLLQITAATVLHNYVDDRIFLDDEVLMVLHDVLVLQLAQNIDFRYDLLFFLLIHLAVVHFFPHHDLTVALSPYFTDLTKTAYKKGQLAKFDKFSRITHLCQQFLAFRTRPLLLI